MTYAAISGAHAASANATTSAKDTTGADLIAGGIAGNAAAGTVTDNKGNTYSYGTDQQTSQHHRQFYTQAPTVGSGHTLTGGTTTVYGLAYQAFSGSTTSPYDQEARAGNQAASLAPGSITPSQDNELVLTSASMNSGQTATGSAPSGYTLTDAQIFQNSVNIGIELAYQIQTTATATNPTWTWTGVCFCVAQIASFKAAAGGGGPTTWGRLLSDEFCRIARAA